MVKSPLLLNLGELGLEVTNARMIRAVPGKAVSGVLANCHGRGEHGRGDSHKGCVSISDSEDLPCWIHRKTRSE